MTDSLPQPGKLETLLRRYREWGVALRFEQSYPLLGGLTLAFAAWWSGLTQAQGTAIVDGVLAVAVSAAAILAGFQATAQSVMLALIDSPSARFLKRVKKFNLLIQYHWAAIASLLLFVAVSLWVLVTRSLALEGETVSAWALLALAFLLGWSSLASVRITRLMVKLLMHKDHSDDETRTARSGDRA